MRVMLIEKDSSRAGLVAKTLSSPVGAVSVDWQQALEPALESLFKGSFDVVLLDLDLPGNEELDFLRQLRSEAPQLPIVAVAGATSEEQALRTLQLGAQDYLDKAELTSANLKLTLQLAIERKQLADMRLDSLQDLEGRQKDMESFVYSICHDLKEPLRTIEAFSSFVLADYAAVLDDKGRDYLSRMSAASNRMKGMIEELLLLTQLGRKPHELQRIDMHAALDEIIAGSQASISEKKATVTVDKHLPDVLGDPPRIAQIFGNLIGNGLKFNRSKKPTVHVSHHESTPGWVTFCVKDNGIGIEKQYHDRIFGVFQRLHTAEEFSGSGAGLTISKSAVEALGGSIRLESEPEEGTSFFVRLPLWEEPDAARATLAKEGAAA